LKRRVAELALNLPTVAEKLCSVSEATDSGVVDFGWNNERLVEKLKKN
jgi:hypothetical protein